MEGNKILNHKDLDKKLKAIIIGSTGAVGRELVDVLLKSNFYSNVTVLARRKIDRWEKLSKEESEKLRIINIDSLDMLEYSKEKLEEFFGSDYNFDCVFCCLGSRVGRGKEFTRVDYDYVVYSADLAEKLNIPHFSLVSSKGVDSKSCMLYLRTKGLADEECLKKNIPYISILRPGLIMNRDNDYRFGEKVASYIPFIPKIRSHDLAKALAADDVEFHFGTKSTTNVKRIISHSEIEKLKNNKI